MKITEQFSGYVCRVLWILHLRPANQPTVTVVALFHKELDIPVLDFYPEVRDSSFERHISYHLCKVSWFSAVSL